MKSRCVSSDSRVNQVPCMSISFHPFYLQYQIQLYNFILSSDVLQLYYADDALYSYPLNKTDVLLRNMPLKVLQDQPSICLHDVADTC